MKKQPDTRYIQCGKHKKRRWSMVCVHLCHGISSEWIAIPQSVRGKYFDWVCPKCDRDWERTMKERDLKLIRPVCVVCVERIRSMFDPNYKPNLN